MILMRNWKQEDIFLLAPAEAAKLKAAFAKQIKCIGPMCHLRKGRFNRRKFLDVLQTCGKVGPKSPSPPQLSVFWPEWPFELLC